MSTLRNPVGPQPPQVYWRRRLMVGLGVVAVVVIVLLIIFRPGSVPDSNGTPKPVAGSETTAPAEEITQEEGAVCNPGVVEVTAVTDKQQYAAGQQPMISISIVNNSAVACMLDVGSDTQLLKISSGSEVYWKSTDCQVDPKPVKIALKPGEPVSTDPIPWNRTRSNPDNCEGERPAVTAGGASYHLSVQVGDIESEKTAQFLLY